MAEEAKYAKDGKPSLMAKQFGELTMANMDGDTVPFLWRYANRFALFDHIFQSMVGPSTPGNLAIIAAQSGQIQEALHSDEAYAGDGNSGKGEPVLNDSDPLWGSPEDKTTADRQPVNPKDFPGYGVQLNQTYATLPLSLAGKDAGDETSGDRDAAGDIGDIRDDIAFLSQNGKDAVPWGRYEEGYDKAPTDSGAAPTDANGLHASYITHHNGPQYFDYIANDPAVQKNFLGDDDHPAYSDAQISEALLAKTVNAIARSRYWSQCAIVITWDDSEGDYDHVPPPIRSYGPDKSVITVGPRVPLLVISPSPPRTRSSRTRS